MQHVNIYKIALTGKGSQRVLFHSNIWCKAIVIFFWCVVSKILFDIEINRLEDRE